MPAVVLTTVAADFDADALAHALVEARLAACVNILPPIRSVYRWEGKVVDDTERMLIIKTDDARIDELRTELLRLHPYQVPEFVVISIDQISDAYGKWLLEQTTPGSSPA